MVFAVSDAQMLVPRIEVLLEGMNLKTLVPGVDLVAASVLADLEAPTMFSLKLHSRDLSDRAVTWIDAATLAVGHLVEIQMGYGKSLQSVIVGEITGLEPEFSAEQGVTLTLRGYDLRHRLMRGRKTKVFRQRKDSAIVQEIAQRVGLQVQAEDTQVVHEYVQQNNQTDWAFLQERADRIGYELLVTGRQLHFRPSQQREIKLLTLKFPQALLEFMPRLSTLGQVGQVEVRGWDMQAKQPIVSATMARTQAIEMGGSSSGPLITVQAFGDSSQTIVTQPVRSRAEADPIAQGQFTRMALRYIEAEGTARGHPEIQAGTVVELVGLGRRFSGLYYLVAVHHTYHEDQGYRTEFRAWRNAS